MNSPRPWSYHQKAITVATSRAGSALAIRLRSSARRAISDIVAAGSRGGRRRRPLGPTVTVVLPGRGGSVRAVGRAGLLGAGAQLRGTRLGDPRLLGQLGAVLVARGRRRRDDLAADRGGPGGVARAEPPVGGVVVPHALHLALEDAQRAPERPR